jgi:hypothetical protein
MAHTCVSGDMLLTHLSMEVLIDFGAPQPSGRGQRKTLYSAVDALGVLRISEEKLWVVDEYNKTLQRSSIHWFCRPCRGT